MNPLESGAAETAPSPAPSTPSIGRSRAAPGASSLDRLFYVAMAFAAAAAVAIGFAPTFYLRSRFEGTPLPVALAIHGTVFTAWIALFAAQTLLVAGRRPAWHRRLGILGAALAPAMIVAALSAAILAGRRDVAAGYGEAALAFFATPVTSIGVFAVLAGAAFARRARPETHKRLMLLATISILDPAVGRWPIEVFATSPLAYYGVPDAMIVAAMLYDAAARGRVAPAYLWGGAFIVASQFARETVGTTGVWQAFAAAILST
ncbi:MAG TPA: hypothetical protein VFV10_07985 [Gammaproteobacteria bacterium]|nr:hypothetical protein [Gammaproteobacteria bacterium]